MPIRKMPDKREYDINKLRALAFIDDLTSLYNRRYLYRYLPTEVKDIRRLGQNLCLFMMDVDNFKTINDTYGHLCGDAILVGIAEILRRCLREGDTIARYAGDEFIAILPGAEEAVAVNVANRITKKIDSTLFKGMDGKANIHVTLSIGLAFFPRDAEDPEKLINQADQALYASKRGGRNAICTARDIPAEVLDETKLQQIFPTRQLFGREKELRRFEELLAGAGKNKSKFVLIEGKKGIGKTRLLNEFKKQAQENSVITMSVACSPENSSQPYQALISGLGNLFTSLGDGVCELIEPLPQAQLAQLADYIPALKTFLPEDFQERANVSNDQSQLDLFKGICQSLIYIVKRNTLVLMIDEFHWIDKETLQLLHYIVKDLNNVPILIVGACQQEKLKQQTGDIVLQNIFNQMHQQKLIDELTLEPLEKEAVVKMITTLFSGIRVSPEFVQIVYDSGAGNPLFIEEALRALVKKGFIFYRDKVWHSKEIEETALPPFLRKAIHKRVSELDEETKPIVAAASIIGEAFDFDTLCRLVEKDPGYVLEAVDRAKRQHLIVPESPFQSDKFRFHSGVIRDIVYEDISIKDKRELHRKLALLEEKTYQNNLDSVVGSLGYHFAKAQDAERSALYKQMLSDRVKQMPDHEDLFSFLQEAMLEETEDAVEPLSALSMKLVPALIRSLRLATQNVRLYPAHSAIRMGFIDQADKYLGEILANDTTVIIGTAEGRLLINGEEISERASREAGSAAFIAILIEARIKSIIFSKDFSKQHLALLLEGLSQNYDDLISQGGLSGMLRKSGVSRIRVNEVTYVSSSKLAKQRARLEDGLLVDYLLGRPSSFEPDKTGIIMQLANDPQRLAETLIQIAGRSETKDSQDTLDLQAKTIVKSLQKLNEQLLIQTKGAPGPYHQNFAEAVLALDSGLRSRVLQTKSSNNKVLTDKTQPQDLIRDIMNKFSEEQALRIIGEEYRRSPHDLTNLNSLTRRLLAEEQRKQRLAPQLKQKLLELGLSPEEISLILEGDLWQGLSTDEKVDRLLKLTPESYLKFERTISKNIEKLLTELLDNNRYNQANAIIDKLLRQLEDASNQVRAKTVKILEQISRTLVARQKHFLLEQIISAFLEKLDKEQDNEVYSALASALAGIGAQLLKKQNFIQAAGILREFNFLMGKQSRLPDAKKQLLKNIKSEIVAQPETIGWLAKLLKEKIEQHQEFWELSKVINEIGVATVKAIFELAISKSLYSDPFETYAFRWSIAKVFKPMGEETVSFLKERLLDKKVENIKVALQLLGHMQTQAVVRYLHPLLKHKDLQVRKDAIITLGKISGSEAIKCLSESINDKQIQIRWAAVWALANIGSEGVLPLLKPLLQEQEFSAQVQRIIQRIEKK